MPKPKRRPRINLFNLSPWNFGGFTSVTVHAFWCLQAAGWDVRVLRPNLDRDESKDRLMALDVPYRNVSVDTAMQRCMDAPSLMTGVAREKDLRDPDTIYKMIDAGCHVVVHGYTEHKQFQHLEKLGGSGQGVCVRESMKGIYPGVDQYLPHPYCPTFFSKWCDPTGQIIDYDFLKRRKPAGSVAMVVKHKNPEIILEANRRIPPERRIKFLGGEDRMYAKFTLSQKYPEYEFVKRFSNKISPVMLCRNYELMVDLTVFGAGNGGTQYTFMEAMDAGCVLIVHRDWLNDVGCMHYGENCLAVGEPIELSNLVRGDNYLDYVTALARGYASTLQRHGPEAFSNAVESLLC